MAVAKSRSGLDHRAYRRATKRLRATNATCWICGTPIDRTLPYTHPMSWTADHVKPRSKGGALIDTTNLRAAHRRCNSARGNRESTKADIMPTTRTW